MECKLSADKKLKGSEMASTPELRWSIPSVVDGLNRGQRKILFSSFKNNRAKPYKVSELAGYAVEQAAYSHGQKSAEGLIIAMAQGFVGSNNINLLEGIDGPFGTRHHGGKNHGDGRHFNMLTCLSPVTRFLFPEDDDILLNYLQSSGRSVEPTWYVPIIPMVLVNGSTGCNSNVPNYNPRDIIANLRRLLNGESMEPMDPWYKGFKGRIEKISTTDDGSRYTTTGVIEVISETRLCITEVPIHCWLSDYRDFLESMAPPCVRDVKDKNRLLERIHWTSYDQANIKCQLMLDEKKMELVVQEGLEKKFNLITTVGTTNMHLFDRTGLTIRKYRTPEEILKEFFDRRLEYYAKRKTAQLEPLDLALRKVANKLRFILGVRNGDIKIDMKRDDFVRELHKQGFDPFPNNPASRESGKGGVTASDYEYLLSIQICDMLEEQVRSLCADRRRLEEKFEKATRVALESLWMRDLDALEVALDRLDDASRAETEARAKAVSDMLSKPVTKRKKPAKKASANNGDDGARNGGGKRGRKPAAKKLPPNATTDGAVATMKCEAAAAGVEGEAKDSKAEKMSKILLMPAAEEEKPYSVASPVKKVRQTRGGATANTGDSVALAAATHVRVTRGMKKAQSSS